MNKTSPSRISVYYAVIVAVVLVLGTVASFYTYQYTAKSTQDELLKNVSSLASLIEPSGIMTLSGSEADLVNPSYISLKSKLEHIPQINDDIRFVYLWGYRDGNPYFMMDSEPAESEDYSPPGQIYGEATDLDRQMFLEKLPPSIEFSTDRWGTWLSGLSPILNPVTGDVAAVLGVDISASKYQRIVYVYTAIPVLTTIFVVILLLTGFAVQRKEEEFIAFKSELVSIASHEIRSPLGGISWLSETLLNHSDNLTSDQKDDVTTINTKSRELLNTINNLLDSASFDKSANEAVRKSVAVKDLFDMIKKLYVLNLKEKGISLDIDPSIGPEMSIIGDPDRLSRMFSNIVSNAIKYSKKEGRVVVGAEDKPQRIIFSVKDSGIGIPVGDKSKVFKGYFRSKNAHEVTKNGTGLGLYYVKQIAEAHKGKVWYESEEGKGTTFYIELPKA